MAHLRGNDRGQLMLVGALALAVLFVSFAFLLNTAIYTETVASRGTNVEADNVVGYRNAALDATSGTIHRLSVGQNGSYDSLNRNFTAGMAAWDGGTARGYATEGDAPGVEVTAVTNGTRVVQNQSRQFTNASTEADWTLASDVRTRNYTITVKGGLTDETDPFHVEFDNGSEYSLYIYDTGSGVELLAEDDSGTDIGSCSRAGPPTEIDFGAGTADGAPCDALDFYRSLGDSYDVRYDDADDVTGTYSLTVSKEFEDLDGSHYATYGGSGPFRSTAIYSADVEIVYRSPSVYYRTNRTVAPGAAEASP